MTREDGKKYINYVLQTLIDRGGAKQTKHTNSRNMKKQIIQVILNFGIDIKNVLKQTKLS